MLRTSLRTVLAHKTRMALSVLAVTLGVAFVSGTLVFSGTITAAFTGLLSADAADVTATPRAAFPVEVEDQAISGAIPSLPAAAVARVAAVPGVGAAHGEVSVQNVTVVNRANTAIGPTSGAPTLGYNWYPRAHPIATLASGHPPIGPGQVVLDQTSAAAGHVRLGDPVRVITPAAATEATVVGLARSGAANPGVGLVFLDTPTAQAALLGRPGAFTGITADAAPGANNAAVATGVAQALGPGVTVQTREQQAAAAAARVGSFLDVITYALLGFAGIAVLVGLFLIFNTFTMLVAGRTRELGLLRALGATRRQVTTMVLGEALTVGAVGATVGLGAGIGLAAGLKAALGGFGVDLSAVGLVIDPTTVLAAYAVGIPVTLAAAYLPARRAGRSAPMAALRATDSPTESTSRARVLGGGGVLALGVAALVALLVAQPAEFGVGAVLFGVGVLASLAGLVVLGPPIARLLVGALTAGYPRLFGALGRLGARNAVRNPRRTAVTAAALMIGVSLVSTLGVVAASLDTSITRQVTGSLGADYVLTGRGGAPLPPQVTELARGLPGVSAVTRQRYAPAQFRGGQISLSGVDTATLDAATHPTYLAGNTAALARGGLDVDAATAAADRLTLGSPVHLDFVDGTAADLRVAAISAPPAGGGKDGSVFQVSLDTLTRYVPQARDFTVYLSAAPGAAPALGESAHRALAGYPQVTIQSKADYQKALRGQVDLVLELLYALLGLAVVIAVLGVINTLALSVVERTREIGLLRAVGTTRAQIRRLIRLEAVAVAVHGALLGLALGLTWGAAGVRLLAGYGITDLTIPWPTIAAIAAGSVLVGLAAAALPARRAAHLDVLDALATT